MSKSTKDIKVLAGELYNRMVAREEEAIEKIRRVIEFATNDDCGYHAWSCLARISMN